MTANATTKPRKIQSFVARARVDEVERPLRDPEGDDRGEHQQRAGHRVDDELDVAREPARPAPDADQDVERDQHRLEEGVEEQQVLRGEDADDRAGEEEHQPVVGARALAAGPARVGDRGRADDDRQAGQPEREAVEADVVRDAEVAEPVCLVAVLEAAARSRSAASASIQSADLGERDEDASDRPPSSRGQRDQPDDERAGDGRKISGRQLSTQRTAMKTTTRTTTEARDRERVRAQQAGLDAAPTARADRVRADVDARSSEPSMTGSSIHRPERDAASQTAGR